MLKRTLSIPRKVSQSLLVSSLAMTASAHAADLALEEVIVTAQKQAQSLQDVPISVSAVDGEKLKEAGIARIQDLTAYVPNFKMAPTGQGNAIFIRGVGAGDNRGFEQSVGMFIDGIYAGRGQQFRAPFLDIALVEVLKGPQGTLFGKNTIAGAVNITSAMPNEELSGEVSVMYEHEYGDREDSVVLNLPLADGLYSRFAYKRTDTDGYLDNRATGEQEMPRNDEVYRASFRWEAGDNFDLGLKLEKGDFGVRGVTHQLIDKTGTFNLYLSNLAPQIPLGLPLSLFSVNLEDYVSPEEDAKFDNVKYEKQFDWQPAFTQNGNEAAVVTANWELGDHTLTSITGYSAYDLIFVLDADFSDLQFIGTENEEDFEQLSQEFRLVGSLGERFDYIAGVYYHQQDLENSLWINLDLDAVGVPSNLTLPSALDPILAPLGLSSSISLPTQLATFSAFEQDSESIAIFGQLTFAITEALNLTIGLRWGEDEKRARKFLNVAEFRSKERTPNPIYIPIALALNNSENHDISDSRSIESLSPAANLQWYINEDIMTYVRYAKGFKDGGFNANDTTSSLEVFEFDDEEADTYELGIKATLLEGSATFNANIFYSEFVERQVSTFTLSGFIVGNAAESETLGLETDIRWRATEKLTLGASAAWLDSSFGEFTNGPCTASQEDQAAANNQLPCRQDLSGERTDYAPEITLSLTANYTQPIGDSLELRLQGDINYSDEYLYTQDGDTADMQEAYAKLNARVALSSLDYGWELALVGKNLTSELVKASGNDVPLFVGASFAATEPPRTLGLQAVFRF